MQVSPPRPCVAAGRGCRVEGGRCVSPPRPSGRRGEDGRHPRTQRGSAPQDGNPKPRLRELLGQRPPGAGRGCTLRGGGAPGSGGEEGGQCSFTERLSPRRCPEHTESRVWGRGCIPSASCAGAVAQRQGPWEPREIQRALVHGHALAP